MLSLTKCIWVKNQNFGTTSSDENSGEEHLGFFMAFSATTPLQ